MNERDQRTESLATFFARKKMRRADSGEGSLLANRLQQNGCQN